MLVDDRVVLGNRLLIWTGPTLAERTLAALGFPLDNVIQKVGTLRTELHALCFL